MKRAPGFKTNDPLNESIAMSNIDELIKKDQEYTLKAQNEGKPFYKWNTEIMTMMIYQNGIDDVNEIKGTWGFISHWLALTLKFVEDETVQYYMQEFYAGRIHYLDEYQGQTLYHHMYDYQSSYVYVLYCEYLRSTNPELKYKHPLPDFIINLRMYFAPFCDNKIRHKIPSKNGLSLIEVGYEAAQKYNGLWISPEEKKQRLNELDELVSNIMDKQGSD